MTPGGRPLALALLFALLALGGCKHTVRLPGGDIRIGEEPEPVAPIVTPESLSGGLCGPGLPSCPGATRCFDIGGKSTCMTEDAACAAAGCANRPCQILESFPMRVTCH